MADERDYEAEAAAHGHVTKDQWKGAPEKWVDAKTYMERAETFIPFLRKQNRDTEALLERERQERLKLSADLEASRKSIETLNKLHEEDRLAAVEEARKEVKAQIAQAAKDGNTEVLGELTEQLVKLNAPAAPRAGDEIDPGDKGREDIRAEPQLHPDFIEWTKRNPWYGIDAYKSDLALTEARRLRRTGDTSNGTEFFDKVAAGVDKILRPQASRSRVEASSLEGGGGGLTGDSNYDNLPAEAKSECAKEAKRRVGPDKSYKTVAEWNKRYAELYFSQPGVRQ